MKHQRLHALADRPHHAARIEVHRPRSQPDLVVALGEIDRVRSGVALVHVCYRAECGAERLLIDHWSIFERGQQIAAGLADAFAVTEFLRNRGIVWPSMMPVYGGERSARGQFC